MDLTKFIEGHQFAFDAVYDSDATNESIYTDTVRPLVSAAFDEAKVTCFAYGQTGSGKTYTMLGEPQVPGLYILAARDIFANLRRSRRTMSVSISFYEIYCGKLRDLLNERQELAAREDANQVVNIVGLEERIITSADELMQLIEFGLSQRASGVTAANDDSSRSHAVLNITLLSGTKALGKISFIDLAGSERGADVHDADKQTRIDGAEINKSLLALKECIRALDQEKRHTPFRGSKLTQVLKDSFTGNCRTLMIANISPSDRNCEHTLNTLRYADRVKELKKSGVKAHKNMQDMLADSLMLPRVPSNTIKKGVGKGKGKPEQQQDRKVRTEEALQRMSDEHERLIGLILNEEENLAASHRQHIDAMVDVVKQEMGLLHEVDKPGSDVDEYVTSLLQALNQKARMIETLKEQVMTFQSHLKEEQELSKQFYEAQSDIPTAFESQDDY